MQLQKKLSQHVVLSGEAAMERPNLFVLLFHASTLCYEPLLLPNGFRFKPWHTLQCLLTSAFVKSLQIWNIRRRKFITIKTYVWLGLGNLLVLLYTTLRSLVMLSDLFRQSSVTVSPIVSTFYLPPNTCLRMSSSVSSAHWSTSLQRTL